MTAKPRTHIIILAGILLAGAPAPQASGQTLTSLGLSTTGGVQVHSYTLKSGQREILQKDLPLFSFLLGDTLQQSGSATAIEEGDSVVFSFRGGLKGSVRPEKNSGRGWKSTVTLQNATADTLTIANVVPFGEGPDHTYITATGPTTYLNRLSRSALFRTGWGPIGVVLPDNAWEMGFCDVRVSPTRSLVAIARRSGSDKGDERRFRTILAPGGSVRYDIYADEHAGDWQEGVRLMFQERWLYDRETFSDTLFQRADLQWIRHSYLMTLLFAWDEQYRDRFKGEYSFEQFLARQRKLLGDYDVFMIWPTWPRLGIDDRNQFDLYRDMPGGLRELRRQANVMHRRGGKYFISYNPWDESTRHEEHLRGMEELMRQSDADGVVLDTWGESSREFQAGPTGSNPGSSCTVKGWRFPKICPGLSRGAYTMRFTCPPRST